jgi:hypothetical protein
MHILLLSTLQPWPVACFSGFSFSVRLHPYTIVHETLYALSISLIHLSMHSQCR